MSSDTPPPLPDPDEISRPEPFEVRLKRAKIAAASQKGEEVDPDQGGLLPLILHHSITVLIMVLVLTLGVWGYLNFRDAEFFTAVDRHQLEATLQPSLVEAQQQRLSAAVEVYALIHNRYPSHLRELVDQELLTADDLYYPAGRNVWSYELVGDSFELQFDPPEPTEESENSPAESG